MKKTQTGYETQGDYKTAFLPIVLMQTRNIPLRTIRDGDGGVRRDRFAWLTRKRLSCGVQGNFVERAQGDLSVPVTSL